MLVHYINVGQADATLLEFYENEQSYYILIDAGNWNDSDVVTYLKEHEVTHLDIIIGTHPHADHIGQLDQLLAQFDVTEVWMSGDEANSQTFERVLESIIESGVDYHEPRANEVYEIGPLVIEIINPIKLTGDVHEGSISLRALFGDVSFLFTGDAEEQTEQAMIDRGHELDATVLQLGHHGSNTSTIPAFLQKVNPEVAVISAGKDNQYGHPHEEVVTRVQEANIDLFVTYVHGTIIVSTDGKTYSITTSETDYPFVANEQNRQSAASKEESPRLSCIDINRADLEELEAIVHIGSERAATILDLRPFETIDDLEKIKGIGPGRLADILEENIACIGG